jgi:hypothetical protein
MPDYFVVYPDRKTIAASSDMPTTLRNLSGEIVYLHNPATGADSTLAVGSAVELTATHLAHSLGANVSMTRSQ